MLFLPYTLFDPGQNTGNGTPLQYSCLKKPMDGRAWWAAVYGVTQSRTRLSDLAAAAAIREGLVDMWKDFQR